jgi:hypothetical protein
MQRRKKAHKKLSQPLYFSVAKEGFLSPSLVSASVKSAKSGKSAKSAKSLFSPFGKSTK